MGKTPRPARDPGSEFDLRAELANHLAPMLEVAGRKLESLRPADPVSKAKPFPSSYQVLEASFEIYGSPEVLEHAASVVDLLMKALPKTARVSPSAVISLVEQAVRDWLQLPSKCDPMQIANDLVGELEGMSELSWLAALRVSCPIPEGNEIHTTLSTSSTPVVIGRCPVKETVAAEWAQRAFELLEIRQTEGLEHEGEVVLLFVENGDPSTATQQAIQTFNDLHAAAWIACYMNDPKSVRKDRPKPEAYHHQPYEATGIERLIMYRIRGGQISQEHVEENLLASFTLPALSALQAPSAMRDYQLLSQWLRDVPAEHPDLAKEKLLRARLMRSIRAFGRALNHVDSALAFLFAVVALESLVERRPEGLRDAFSNVGALLSESDPAARIELSEVLRSAYDLRSKLVHQAILPTSKMAASAFQECRSAVDWAYIKALTKVLPLGEKNLTDDAYFGALGRMKLGVSWEDAWTSGKP